jgi:hydroxyacylglutathione hydrolase
MNNYHSQKQEKNITALMVGFFLVILVMAIFVLKTHLKNNKTFSKDSSEELNIKNYSNLSVEDLVEKNKGQNTPIIFDVRNEINFSQEHIIGSLNMPKEKIEKSLSDFNREKEYVLIDDLGLTPLETETMDFLEKNGFENIFYLEGGFSAWKSGGNRTVSFGDPYSLEDQSKVNYIKSDELKKIIAEENNLYLIDLRNNKQFSEGHLPNAKNIFLDDLENRRREIPSGMKIILYDQDGLGAFLGAVRLFDMGFMNVFSLADGLNTWKEKNFEIVK